MSTHRRVVASDVLPLMIAAVLTAIPFFIASRLPDPIAVHWDIRGRPDGELALALFAPLSAGLILLAWLPGRIIQRQYGRAPALLATYSMVGLATVVELWVLWANHGVTTWHEARSLNVVAFLASILALGGLGAAIGRALDRQGPGRQPALPRARPSLGLRKNEYAAGVYIVRAPRLMALMLAPLLALVFLRQTWRWILIAILTTPLALAFSRVRVSISDAGIEAAFGPWRWPRKRVPIERVTGASVVIVNPMEYGGWGYRAGRRVRAIILRGGPALRIETTDQDLVITMPHPEEQAGLINDIVTRTT